MLVPILTTIVAAGLGFFLGRKLREEKKQKSIAEVLTTATPITLSLVEIEEAGFSALIKDLTKFKILVDTTSGEKFVEIPLEDLLQVIVQKFRQLNLEIEDLAKR